MIRVAAIVAEGSQEKHTCTLQMETNLADFAEKLGEPTAGMYQKAAANRKTAVNTLLWDHAKGQTHETHCRFVVLETSFGDLK